MLLLLLNLSVHNDELHIAVEEGIPAHLMLPLVAKGVGTSMFCQQDISLVDFGVQLTSTHFERKIVLENKGNRPQQLRWVNTTNKEQTALKLVQAKKLDKSGRSTKNLPPVIPYFTVTPEEITLRPLQAVNFLFRGTSAAAGVAAEQFVLESRVGKERGFAPIFNSSFKANIVDPLLIFSERELLYSYAWARGEEPAMQRKEVLLTNSSAVPLHFVLKTETPFNLSSFDHSLVPGQSVEIVVDFDPAYKDDRTSHVVEKQLVVAYRGHPQKDIIVLKADIRFPNIKFEHSTVNFGRLVGSLINNNDFKISYLN